MSNLKPFFKYAGGKFRSALRYPAPSFGTIVEPFAGSAGYSLRHADRKVILVERYEVVAAIWSFLIGATEGEILGVPLTDSVDDLPSRIPQELRWLVGFWMNAGVSAPRRNLSVGNAKNRELGRKFCGWSEPVRSRVASQLHAIRHWKVIHGDYREAPNLRATWFVDPPYQRLPGMYVHANVDYGALGRFCLARRGQTIVCEGKDADWLPFRRIGMMKSGAGKPHSMELIWERRS